MDTGSFTEALDIANSGRVDIAKAQREAAESYLMALQSTPEGLNLSFHILTNEPVSAAPRFFWATNTILYHLPALAGTISGERAEEIYQNLLACIHRYFISTYNSPPTPSTGAFAPPSTVTDLIVNKHAQVMVAGFQLFFPLGHWNRLLPDILEVRRRAAGQFFEDQVTMYVLRVLEYIDERVVSVRDRADRDKEQRESDMKIKDAMREAIIPELVQMWYEILFDSRSHRPEMIKLCLDVVKLYAEWIDIGLLLEDRWIHLLYYFATLPMYRESVCECLLSLVNKKQLPDVKRETLLRLHIVEQIPKLMQMLWETVNTPAGSALGRGPGDMSPAEDGSPNGFADGVTLLVTAVATHLLTVVDACGAALRQSSPNPLREHAESTLEALHLVVSYLIDLTAALQLTLPISEVLIFFQAYVKSAYFTESESKALLDPLFKRTILPGVTLAPELVWDEGVIEDRKSILLVARLIFRRYPEMVCQHLQHIVWCATKRAENSPGPSSAADGSELVHYASPPFLEAVLRYVYEMGNAMKLEVLKDPAMPLTQVVERLLRWGQLCFFTPVNEERRDTSDTLYGAGGYATAAAAVHLGFFETMCRYHLFVVYHPDYLSPLLELLLLRPFGVLHPHERTRGRICSLFRQLVFALLSGGPCGSSPLLPYAIDVVKALEAVVAMGQAGIKVPDSSLSANDRRELFEAMGMLLSAAAVTSSGGCTAASGEQRISACREQLQVVSTGLLEQLGATSQEAEARRTGAQFSPQYQYAQGGAALSLPEDLVADCLSFCSAWAKGLRLGHSNVSTPNTAGPSSAALWQADIASTLLSMLSAIGPIWHTLQFSSVIRDRTGQFFGQLINTIPMYGEALEEPFKQYLVSSLSTASNSSAADLNRVMRLLHQLVGKAGRGALSTLEAVIPLIWECMKQCVGPLPALPASPPPTQELPAPHYADGADLGPRFHPAYSFGVLSETCRECVEVYKNYFMLLVNAATFSCSHAILTLPENTLQETLEQLRAALPLPAELDVPKGALQLLTRLLESGDGGKDATVLEDEARLLERLRGPILYIFIPTALFVFTSPSFDWRDAKNTFLSTEFALMTQGAVKRFGEDVLQVLFTSLEPYTGAEAAQRWCVQLRDESKVTASMKSELRQMLHQIQQARTAAGRG
eukprot:gene6257-4506_t